jgi:hypothetical protein
MVINHFYRCFNQIKRKQYKNMLKVNFNKSCKSGTGRKNKREFAYKRKKNWFVCVWEKERERRRKQITFAYHH